VSWNMGIAGAYPIVAGLEEYEKIRTALLKNIRTEGRLLCEFGLSSVDISAPYYDPEGYWNGRVWMAHQWVFWKALLDMGEVELASEMAHRALKTYSKAERLQGHCFENFLVSTGKGAGTPHFGALSAPVLSFYCAYFTPGRVSSGFDSFISDRENDDEGFPLKFTVNDLFRKPYNAGIVVVLMPDTEYEINGQPVLTDKSGAVSFAVCVDKKAYVTIRRI
ncbi:MAG: hypothetical protein JNL74_11390, partial [Fibrobacteres bacterium]|nr:hypothetical protein [Fibrobacterota bacterium]